MCALAPAATLLQQLHRILVEYGVSTHQGKLFMHCLCDQQPIKWIAMMKRQAAERQDVGKANHQQFDAILSLLIRDDRLQGGRSRQFAQLHFDLHLPDAR
jgi:hypothetical protein